MKSISYPPTLFANGLGERLSSRLGPDDLPPSLPEKFLGEAGLSPYDERPSDLGALAGALSLDAKALGALSLGPASLDAKVLEPPSLLPYELDLLSPYDDERPSDLPPELLLSPPLSPHL